MVADIRAVVRCNLGTLISASISDDYIQGSGLIKTRGTCELSGLYTPEIGKKVTFTYVKDGVARVVPRVLRVMSTFADPFRRTTKVELGCKLTYLQDLQDPIKWTALNDPENSGISEETARAVPLPIYARSILDKCLTELGLEAIFWDELEKRYRNVVPIMYRHPLTNAYTLSEFDYGPGYVSVLSDLLVSESYCGYLNYEEKLTLINLSSDAGSGPVITTDKLIDVGPINVGQLPGDAVVVRYSTYKVRTADQTEIPTEPPTEEEADQRAIAQWELSASISGPNIYPFAYTDAETGESKTLYSIGTEYTRTDTTYGVVYNYATGEQSSLPFIRITLTTAPEAKVAGSIINQYLEAGLEVTGSASIEAEKVVTTYEYTADTGAPLQTVTTTYNSFLQVAGSLPLQFVFFDPDTGSYITVKPEAGLVPVGREIVTFSEAGNARQTITRSYRHWAYSIPGQQALASAAQSIDSAYAADALLGDVYAAGLVHVNTTTNIDRSGIVPGRPANILQERYAEEDADPTDGYRLESVAQIELVSGDPTAQRRIEFTMPLAPDDWFVAGGSVSYLYRSDAAAKANLFGRVQNRILFGNRNGMNIQTVPEKLPNAPFGIFYVNANGVVSQYRTNGTTWTMDSNGILASTDALYWGVVGKSS